jgi:hypothetical protein
MMYEHRENTPQSMMHTIIRFLGLEVPDTWVIILFLEFVSGMTVIFYDTGPLFTSARRIKTIHNAIGNCPKVVLQYPHP